MENCCKTEDIMSVCGCPEDQKNCKHYKKASYGNRCMYYKFDAYCDNPIAQGVIKEIKV